MPPLADAMDAVHLSVDRFCLLAGVEALAEMMEEDATTVCGARHRRHGDRRGYRWGRTHSEIGYHGGKVKVARPRVRDRAGKEVSLESWQALRDGNLLLEWALNLMVLNVSTRKYHRAVRLPEGDLAKARGDGTSKSAVSRRFVALSRKKMKAWLASDLSELDLLVIQIDGLHVGDHVLMAAIGVDGNGDKHVLAVVEGATENTVVVQALIDNLLARGLDPTLPRLFIVDGAKALSKAIRNTFGVAAAIQRCQVHKGRLGRRDQKVISSAIQSIYTNSATETSIIPRCLSSKFSGDSRDILELFLDFTITEQIETAQFMVRVRPRRRAHAEVRLQWIRLSRPVSLSLASIPADRLALKI